MNSIQNSYISSQNKKQKIIKYYQKTINSSNFSIYSLPTDCLAQIMSCFLELNPENFQTFALISRRMQHTLDAEAMRGKFHSLIIQNTGDDSLRLSKIFFKLKNLNASMNLILTGAGIVHLQNLALQYINFSGCPQISDESIQLLKDMPLQKLDISSCAAITDIGLLNFPTTLTNLNLSKCKLITDAGLIHLNFSITSLNLKDCDLISGLEGLKKMSLKVLNLSGCVAITDRSLVQLPLTMQYLDISNCKLLTNIAIELINQIPLLFLNLTKNDAITDEGLVHLKNIPLKILNISYCKQITDAGLLQFPITLERLNLSWCQLITVAGIDSLKLMNLKCVHIPLSCAKNILGPKGSERTWVQALQHSIKSCIFSLEITHVQNLIRFNEELE